MCPPAPIIEVTQVVAYNDVRTSRKDPVAIAVGLATMLFVLGIGFALYMAKFQVEGWVYKASAYTFLAAALIWFKLTKPTSALTPVEKSIRARRRVSALLGLLGSISILLSIVVAYSLHTWVDYMLLFLTITSPLALGKMINTRFEMGSG